MPLNQNSYLKLIFLIILIANTFIFGCASIQQPTGGPKDSIPPKILKENPKQFTTNFNSPQINIELDEYFKLNNTSKEISISPDLDKQPEYKIKKKILNIKLQDTLEANTTYTINFGNAIADYNENNVLKNYMYVFSTGQTIDSLSISGTVINSQTKQPQLDATVFLLPLNRDTLFGKKKAHIYTSTDSSGNFKLKYLKEGTYKIYAVFEKDGGDKIYNSVNEEVAFLNKPINLTKDTSGISLQLFKEEASQFKVIDKKIEKSGRIIYTFNQNLASPSITILSPKELNNKRTLEFNKTGDTAYLWTQEMSFDSIEVSIENNGKGLDTVLLRRGKKDDYNRTISIADNVPSGKIKPGTDLIFTFSAPVKTIDNKLITLLQDSVPVKGFRFEQDTSFIRKYRFKYSWKKEKTYDLTISDGAIKGLYGGQNKQIVKTISRDEEDNYGNLSIKFTVPDTSKKYVIQLMNTENQVLTSNEINTNTSLNYTMYSIGKYLIRVVYDENKNGKWDTGNVKKGIQPEKVWNNPNEITLRANWDLEEKITIPPPQ